MILDDEKYMNLALAEAKKAYELGEVPIGAVLVAKDGTTVSVGHNLRETAKDATAHAEIEAIRAANKKLDRWRLSGTTLYVTIEPCPMCAGAIVNSRIDRVVYGGADIKAGAVHSIFNVLTNSNLNHQTEVTAGVLEEPEIIAMTYWQMNPVWVREHLGFMKIRPDRVFDGNDGCTGIDECAGAAENGSVIRAGGADFRVIPLPGHTMDQVGYVTPDGVLYAADAMLERDFLAHAKLPTARSWTVDLETKAGIPAGNYPAVILAHRGCVQGPEILRLSRENIRDRHRRAEELYDVLARRGRELTLEEIQNTLWRALELRTKQELKIRIFQRNVFCLVRYLEDTGRVKEESRDGMVLYRLRKGENEN